MKLWKTYLLIVGILSSMMLSMPSLAMAVSVYWSLQPSSITLYIPPGDSADVWLTFCNEPSSTSSLDWSVMSFGGYYDSYLVVTLRNPPQLAPGNSGISSIATFYVPPTTPYGTVCTCEGCTLEVGVSGGVPSIASVSVTVVAVKLVCATVDFEPDTFNIKKVFHGWVTAYIDPPAGYLVQDFVVETVELEVQGSVFPMLWCDATQEDALMVKFDRNAVASLLCSLCSGCEKGLVEFKITGKLRDGTVFEGCDTIRLTR